jgi:hypothetical protein
MAVVGMGSVVALNLFPSRRRRRNPPAPSPVAAGLDKQKGKEKERRYSLADPPVHECSVS